MRLTSARAEIAVMFLAALALLCLLTQIIK